MLSRLFRRRAPGAAFPPPRPGAVVEIIGDIHGRADLLEALPPPEPGAVRVSVGDYVDRGPASRQVLDYLHARTLDDGWICLRGNHEEMFLDFLDNPAKGLRWLRFGGRETLASFGVAELPEMPEEEILRGAAQRVVEAMSFDLRDWLRGLPVLRSFGTLTVVHAGLDPQLPVEAQSESAAIWGHPEFGLYPRADGQWIAHGHTIVKKPAARGGVISLDTGAWTTGRLTMARVAPDGAISFVTAPGG
ncbi:MAG: metallophosphoesterase family protein [Tropicimonas sp.]|uniref:metallophosphoesterase family protein n=1 Tax=Tropicimonas sp. TaxID=2067044 RepID=UPI003A8B9392